MPTRWSRHSRSQLGESPGLSKILARRTQVRISHVQDLWITVSEVQLLSQISLLFHLWETSWRVPWPLMGILFKRAGKSTCNIFDIGQKREIHNNLYSVPFLRTREPHPDYFFSSQQQYTHLKIIQNQRKNHMLLGGEGYLFYFLLTPQLENILYVRGRTGNVFWRLTEKFVFGDTYWSTFSLLHDDPEYLTSKVGQADVLVYFKIKSLPNNWRNIVNLNYVVQSSFSYCETAGLEYFGMFV